jgi:hypothetical protein
MARETVAEREERERAEKAAADRQSTDRERKAQNAKASREAAAGVTHLEEDATEEEVAEANEAAAKAAETNPPVAEEPVTSVIIHDPPKDVYEDYQGGEALKKAGVTPKDALQTVVIKSNSVATGPIPRPDNEKKGEDGQPMYKARDVITADGVTVMTCDRSTYRAPGPTGAEEWLPPGTIIRNFKGVLSKVHAVIDESPEAKLAAEAKRVNET